MYLDELTKTDTLPYALRGRLEVYTFTILYRDKTKRSKDIGSKFKGNNIHMLGQ